RPAAQRLTCCAMKSRRRRRSMRASVAIAALLLACASCATGSASHQHPVLIWPRTIQLGGGLAAPPGRPTKGSIDHASLPNEDLVQLWVRDSFYAKHVALHPFFLAYDHNSQTWEQWEVW